MARVSSRTRVGWIQCFSRAWRGTEVEVGDEVRLVGFGTFSVQAREASEGRNPRTGEKIAIAASKQAKFKAGKTLKDALN